MSATVTVFQYPNIDRPIHIPYRHGLLYCFALPGGRVKVGRTMDPWSRLEQHDQNLNKYAGVRLGDVWLTVAHSNFHEMETAAHSALRGFQTSQEEFACPIETAVEVLRGLPFEFESFSREEDDRRAEEGLEQLKVMTLGPDPRRMDGDAHQAIDMARAACNQIAHYLAASNPKNFLNEIAYLNAERSARFVLVTAMAGFSTAVSVALLRHSNARLCLAENQFRDDPFTLKAMEIGRKALSVSSVDGAEALALCQELQRFADEFESSRDAGMAA